MQTAIMSRKTPENLVLKNVAKFVQLETSPICEKKISFRALLKYRKNVLLHLPNK